MRSAFTTLSLVGFALLLTQPLAAAGKPEPAALAEADLRPGLLGVYRSLIDGASFERIDRVPHFALDRSSPHPRIPPGPFEVRFSGVLWVEEEPPLGDRGGRAESIRFGGYLGG